MPSDSQHIFSHTPETLQEWAKSHGMPAFRAKQILEWVYAKGVIEPARMTNLSAMDRETLSREMRFLSGATLADSVATDGTRKLLVQWDAEGDAGGSATSLPVLNDTTRQTECVMIPSLEMGPNGQPTRRTACISSQVGCPVGCKFCASGLAGLDGNLTAGRIVEQVWRLRSLLGPDPKTGEMQRISNVVFMGMGEPLANFESVTSAVRTIAAPWGLGISARKITISTVGLPKYIDRLAREFDLPVTLALSLHAPSDDIRRQLIPWAEFTTIADLLASCQRWFEKTGREITLEYTLLRHVNDRRAHAELLAGHAKTLRANVNLIRYNEVKGMPFERPTDEDVRVFQETLRSKGVNAHIRASRGRDIAAACGQLRHEHAAQANGTAQDAHTPKAN